MDSTSEDELENLDDNRPIRYEGKGTRFTGTEPIFGAFTNTSTVISNIRLTHFGQIFAPVVDVSAAVTTLAREYRFHGDAVRAYQDIVRIRANFDGRVQQWRTEETNRLQNKKSMNGNQIRDLEKELNRVRLEIARGESTLNKLQNDLDLISRVGDECPLLKPKEHEASNSDDNYVVPKVQKKRSRKAFLSLARILRPDGLAVKFQTARFHDDFDDTIREMVYDQRTHVALMVHWSDRDPRTRERGNAYVRVLIIPKTIEALEELPDVLAHHRLEMVWGAEQVSVLEFNPISISQEKTIVEKKLMDYLYDIEARSFQHKELIVKKPFEFFAADFLPGVSFEQASASGFVLRLVKIKSAE